MGLTLKCARCHSHKFDPIPQRDYYRLVDVFKGAYDEYDWLKPDVRPGLGPVSQDPAGGRHLPNVPDVERRMWVAHNTKLQAEINGLRSALDKRAETLRAMLSMFVRVERARLPALIPAFRKEAEETEKRIKALEAKRLPEPRVQALWDR